MLPNVLILPDLYGSGPRHWQRHWEVAHCEYRRVQSGQIRRANCDEWIRSLDETVAESGPDVVLAAHSSACAVVGHWWARMRRVVRGALLVAPSDTEAGSCPIDPIGFAPMPLSRLAFRTIVVASENDPVVSFERARYFAQSWGSEFVSAGFAGHIDDRSGFGPWPKGYGLLKCIVASDDYALDELPDTDGPKMSPCDVEPTKSLAGSARFRFDH